MNDDKAPCLGMILKGYPRISETFISNEILALERMGHRVRILSMRQPRESFSHASIKRVRARVDYLPETLLAPLPVFLRHNLRWLASEPGRYRAAAALAARRFARVRKSATLKHLFQAGYLADRLLRDSGVVHLHAHFAHSPTSVAMFASLLTGLPYSFFAHAKDIYTQDPRQLAEKMAGAAFVVTCTEANRRYLHGVAKSADTPIHCVYHGIDLSLFNPKDGPKTEPKPPYRILTVARMVEKKGLPTVYRALRILADSGLDFTHAIIGDGDDREKLKSLVRELGLSDRCDFPGTLPHEEVLGEYEKSDLFTLGCQVAKNGDRDGIPNVLVESMAMGVPVVATEVSAIPELVEHGKTGLLVRPGDPEALAAAMRRLLTEPGLRKTVIERGKAKVAARFDNRVLARQLEEVYKKGGAFGTRG
ncbi:MAG: glycosyltransferase family 4 protein [Desulfatibacillaceae bacterium]